MNLLHWIGNGDSPRPVFPPIPVRTGRAESDEVLKRTTSRCPVCQAAVPADVVRSGSAPGRVWLDRHCPVHGSRRAVIASDSRFYWLSRGTSGEDGQPGACGCAGGGACRASDGEVAGTLGRNAGSEARGLFEKLSTCLALIEVVDSCNLSCPTCYADSPVGTGAHVSAPSLETLQGRIQGVIDRKGGIEILQLSGGEPTLHPRFHELVAWTMKNPGIDYVLLNTNGLRLARDTAFGEGLAAVVRPGKFQLYLQFDGTRETGQRELRGADLRETRIECLRRCRDLGIPVTLAMTVTPENRGGLWEAVEFGLDWPHVRGISFQPMFGSGRGGGNGRGEKIDLPRSVERLNVADVILGLVEQAGGRLRFEDFTPLPCGDPNCATIGYLLKVGGAVRSISDFVDFGSVQGFLRDRVRYSLEDLGHCGCESEPLGALLKQFELDASHTFRLFIKPFMDAWTWDEDRVDRCCTHVIRPDGMLDSFCRYYSGFGSR